MNIPHVLLAIGIALTTIGTLGTLIGLVTVSSAFNPDNARTGGRMAAVCAATLIIGAVLIGATA